MSNNIATTWTCYHCHMVNARPDMAGRVAEEFVCAKCGNNGPATIPANTFDTSKAVLTLPQNGT